MSFQSDIIAHLEDDETITNQVGTRIYADAADGEATAPYLVYSVVTTGGETAHDGTRDVEFPLVQVSCYAATKAQAISIASSVRKRLEGGFIPGLANLTLIFDDQHGTKDAETNLFAEILELRGACNPN